MADFGSIGFAIMMPIMARAAPLQPRTRGVLPDEGRFRPPGARQRMSAGLSNEINELTLTKP